jgi:hypothetical protein
MTIDPMDSTVKFTRACEHLKVIRGIVEAWGNETTYETIMEPDPERSGIVHCVRYVAKIGGPPIPEIPALLGDCLHNFRGALDHLIWLASVLNSGGPPPSPKGIGFPAWDDSATYKAKGLHAVSPKVRAVVETLQPYHAGDNARSHPLWVLCELNNVDKHRELHVVGHVFITPLISVTSNISGQWIETYEDGPVENGTVLARVFTPHSLQPTDVDVNIKVAHGIAIMNTESTPQLHLGSTLDAIRNTVYEAAHLISRALG